MNVLLVCLVAVAVVSAADEKKCEQKCAKCPVVERSSCLAGMQKDNECNCCDVCSRFEGQKCDKKGDKFEFGQCGDGLECKETAGGQICQCVWNEMVCGTNGEDYNNLCQLMAAAVREGLQDSLEVGHIGPCKNESRIVGPPKYIRNSTNENVVLTCEAIGNPVPNLKWEVTRSNGKTTEMPGDDDHIMIAIRGGPGMFKISGWMQIEGLKKRHEGDYTCIASNKHNTDRSTARIKVVN
ncbi:hypothetical protein RRG08_005434 [Elysia crispata]|uniref:IGFBP-related protein 1 n=1 Tax=Elysia crispata TaxID=231223 RepID=A0AAE0Y106_9GAST|nr:hypothetical protein RRG08_005434 [Elysia crispata]